ncbi:MAG: hypothetical protein EA417_18330 [Gammaproteobacteria bacterium]|nr:MAG: hypothetical protein EA417_18330 [Gammaproteobacteria bacterium]
MHVKAHVYSHSPLEEEHVLDLRHLIEFLSNAPDHVLVYASEGEAGGLVAEFSVDEAPQAALMQDIGSALASVVPDVYDVSLAFRD